MQKYQDKSYIFQYYFFVYIETDFIGGVPILYIASDHPVIRSLGTGCA